MKRSITLFLLIIFLFGMSSCKKETKDFGKVDYHFSGVYIELVQDSQYQVGKTNPCVYFDYQKEVFCTDSGAIFDIGPISMSQIGKQIKVENDIKKYILYVTVILPYNAPSEAKFYVIKQDKTHHFFVDQEMVKKIDLDQDGTYGINYQYEFENQKYQIQMTVKHIKQEEV